MSAPDAYPLAEALADARRSTPLRGMEYIRSTYNVPAMRGERVRFHTDEGPRLGTITGSNGPYLRIRLDGDKHPRSFHPTWQLEYLSGHKP